jgi:hypothetical protein
MLLTGIDPTPTPASIGYCSPDARPSPALHSAHPLVVRDYWSSTGPSGERPHRKVRFARLIQRPVRVVGGPTVRAAFGGGPSLPCLPRTVRSGPRKPFPPVLQRGVYPVGRLVSRPC